MAESGSPRAGRRPPAPPGPYLVLGLARSGAAAARALAARGERVIGVDAGMPVRAGALREAGIQLHLGSEPERLLEGIRTLVKSPGVPQSAPLVDAARARGIGVIGELELAWRTLDLPVVAVTGTNGKTTTTELIAHIHRHAGIAVASAGNVGSALSELLLADAHSALPQRVICETSSFQLEDASAFAPEAAVLLNIAPDHLDRHGSFEDYKRAKLRIFANQRRGDIALVHASLADEVRALGRSARLVVFGGRSSYVFARAGRIYWRCDERPGARARALLESSELSLRGAHNRDNALAAAAACLAIGVPAEAVTAGLRDFPGVPHRLEELPDASGILFVNDSKATNIASTLVALRAYGQSREGAAPRIHLILGGQGKGQDFRALRAPLARHVHTVYLIGEDAPRIAAELAGAHERMIACATLERALGEARERARAGDVVLLSPGCASFDQFSSFEARGERFRELVRAAS
ncbi:MAG TPA: UDP-N-acetylmuramoyl-L-alanine--D-glutamate ligase [Solirubrobacteraceae bacterium]|nr:UDP-N-acetylmuramoyl-L-alanine--D-glutamate ligase [Solirubrobacteraceae bacterium]